MVRGIKSLFVFVFCAFIGGWSCASFAVDGINPFSSYGQIQNVQTYSSNPFWNPNGGYRQNMPVPVYVTGPDVSSGDCERTVNALITGICANNNNCHNMQLSDIRPTLMLQLSRLPGHNWATSCAGFIDTAFDNYIRSAEHTVVPTSFPGATAPNPAADGIEYKIPNPFAPKIPDWMREMKGREEELKQLQSLNGAGQTSLARAEFPATYEDLSLAERWANEANGYKPYEDKSSYLTLKLNDTETRTVISKPGVKASANVGKISLAGIEDENGVNHPLDVSTASCHDDIKALIAKFFKENSWGTVNGGECIAKSVNNEKLKQDITDLLVAHAGYDGKCSKKYGGFDWNGRTFYAKFNVYFSADAKSATRVDVKSCCNISNDSDCLPLEQI
ncbi:MAG: hypothetical protein NC311_05470 [Muribaculaceae bacterium]|nr:hypothetical protein [Muribaculaceae bacterium]